MPSAWLRNGPTHRNCSAPTLLLLRKTRRSLAEGTSRQKPPSAPSALPANRHPTGGQTCRPSTGTPGRSPPAWGKLRTRNDGAATALYPLSAPGGGEGWGEVGDSRALADTHLTLPSLRDGPLPLLPEGRRGIFRWCVLRLGLRQIKGFAEADAKRLVENRGGGYVDAAAPWHPSGPGRALL